MMVREPERIAYIGNIQEPSEFAVKVLIIILANDDRKPE
jgi:hypothetical protein